MAIPAIYLAFAMVVLGSLSALAETIGVRTIGTINRGNTMAQVATSAAANALAQIRSQIAAAPAGTLPTIAAPPSSTTGQGRAAQFTTTYVLQSYGTASLGGGATTISQSVEQDTIGDAGQGGTAATNAVIAPRYALQIDVMSTAPDGSTDDRRQVCVVRVYPQAPFADYVSCTPVAVTGSGSQLSADVSGDRLSGTDTSVHSYDICSDTSGSGACSNQHPIDRSTTTTTTGTAAGAKAPW